MNENEIFPIVDSNGNVVGRQPAGNVTQAACCFIR